MFFKMDFLFISFLTWFVIVPIAKGDMPGTYFWRPRLGIDLAIPTTDPSMRIVGADFEAPSEEGIKKGKIVLIERYGAGILMIAIACGISGGSSSMGSLNLMNPAFYTNSYRWLLRYISQVPMWASGTTHANFCKTTQVWPRRFFYTDVFVPKWLRDTLFYIKPADWEKEYQEFRKYKKYSEVAFGRSFRYPNKQFDDWKSEYTPISQRSSQIAPEVSNSESTGVFVFRKRK